jgi:catechol 2,3-dioxygenase-like lactoylglutathione lyase family enzyme
MKINIIRIDHIQICIAKGQEQQGREFYCGILGMEEIEKPEVLKQNGGFWLQLNGFQIHIGIEELIGHTKRHPAFEVENLEDVRNYLEQQGVKISEEGKIPGMNRFSIFDPWQNRIELLEKHA